MARREFTLEVAYDVAKEALSSGCAFLKRSQIEDAYFGRPDGVMARLRRQDTVTRLSCNAPGVFDPDAPETIVLDPIACRRLLELCGFEAQERVRLSRETWRSCQFLLHLDRVEGTGVFLTLESDVGTLSAHGYRRQALKFLKNLGISAAAAGVDSLPGFPYTAPVVPNPPEISEAARTA